jgi:hypothetical protein
MDDDYTAARHEADRIQRIFALLASPLDGERAAAREALEHVFATGGRHPGKAPASACRSATTSS